MSAKIYKAQRDIITSEHLHFWLAGMEQLSLGEAVLKAEMETTKIPDRLGAAVAHYCKAMAAFKVCFSTSFIIHSFTYLQMVFWNFETLKSSIFVFAKSNSPLF